VKKVAFNLLDLGIEIPNDDGAGRPTGLDAEMPGVKTEDWMRTKTDEEFYCRGLAVTALLGSDCEKRAPARRIATKGNMEFKGFRPFCQ
jgi:hypothetical protein